MSKKKPKIDIVRYYRTFHYLLGLGRWDAIRRIKIADKVAWEGEVRDNTVLTIDKPELHGGVRREGGNVGDVHVLFGDPGQVLSDFVAGKYGLTGATSPAYRGLMTLMFTENPNGEGPGFYWHANTPALPSVKVLGERLPDDWYPLTAGIPIVGGESAAVEGEMPEGEYDLTHLNLNHSPGFDFDVAAREFFILSQGTGPAGVDQILVYSMVDHSLKRTIDFSGIAVSATTTLVFADGWFFTEDLATEDIVAISSTGVVTATHPTERGLPGPNAIEVIKVNGQTQLMFHVFRNIGNEQWDTYRWDGAAFTAIGDIATIGTDCTAVGWKDLGATSVFYWYDESDAKVYATTFDATTGFVTVDTGWVLPGGTISEIMYVQSLGLFLLRSNATITAYDETFVQQWSVTHSSSPQLQFPNPTRSNIKTRLALASPASGGGVVIDLVGGAEVDTVSALDPKSTGAGYDYVWDDDGGTLWYSLAGDAFYRIQFEPAQGGDCKNANPVHCIYEICTNTKFGLSAPVALMDDAAFQAAALTLYNEQIGVAFKWTRGAEGEKIIQELLDHIEATIFPDPLTGLLTIKLIRGDYDVANLPEVNDDNARLTKFRRKGWGETTGRMTVTYTNSENEEEATVTMVDPGNIAMQGRTVSDSRNYYMIRHADQAMKLCARDLRAGAYPLASCEAEFDQSWWDKILPGAVVKVTKTFENGDTITDMPMRVSNPQRSHQGDGRISCRLTEDVFGFEATDYATPPQSQGGDGGEVPAELAHALIFTLPWYLAVNSIDAETAEAAEAAGEVFAGFLGAQAGSDAAEYELYGQETDSLGGVSFVSFGYNDVLSRSVLSAALVQEVETTLADFPNRSAGPGAVVGSFIVLGEGPENASEICIVSAFVSGIGFTLKRGMLDTTPKDWPMNTPAWIIPADAKFYDGEEYLPPAAVAYKFATMTSQGQLDLALAPIVNGNLTERPYLPLRPANVTVEGVAFGSVDADGLTDLDVDWSNRNRLTEDAQVLFWDDASVTGEVGQTTVIQALDMAKALINEVTGLVADGGAPVTSHAFPVANFSGADEGYIRVLSERDGKRSLQGHDIHIQLSDLRVLESDTSQVRVLEGSTESRKLED